MPIVFSKPGASAFAEYVPWVNDFIYLTETGQLTEDVKTLGFKAHIPTNDPLLGLTPLEYLKHVRASNAELIARTKATDTNFVRKALKLDVMSEPFPTMTSTQAPTVSFTSPENTTTTRPPLATRKSSTLHKNFVAKLRPLPFQYVWAVWHENPSRSSPPAESTAQNSTTIPTTSYSTRLTLLADSVPDIGAFYRIYNNFPWTSLKLKDTIHIFRAGVKPLWEDKENLDGGAWTLKVRREDGKAVKVWEEICLMGCGGELQAEIAGGELDPHTLPFASVSLSFSLSHSLRFCLAYLNLR